MTLMVTHQGGHTPASGLCCTVQRRMIDSIGLKACDCLRPGYTKSKKAPLPVVMHSLLQCIK